MKRCRICNTDKPINDFCVAKKHKDGRANRCRPCAYAEFKRWATNGPKLKSERRKFDNGRRKDIDGVPHKFCGTCNTWKALQSGFGTDRSTLDGRKSECRVCQSTRQRQWTKNNREASLSIERGKYARNAEAKKRASKRNRAARIEECRARDRKYNRERYAANPAAMIEKTKRWALNNPDKAKALQGKSNADRRARVAAAPGSHTPEQRRWLCESYLHLCAYCTERNAATDLDHVTPLARGGCNHIENLVPACERCNARKGSLSLLQFLIKRAS